MPDRDDADHHGETPWHFGLTLDPEARDGPLDDGRPVRFEWTMVALAMIFLACYAWPILHPTLSTPWRLACALVHWRGRCSSRRTSSA